MPLVVTVELIVTLRTATLAKFVNLAVRLVANIFVPLCVCGECRKALPALSSRPNN